jgi:hypothetical protein
MQKRKPKGLLATAGELHAQDRVMKAYTDAVNGEIQTVRELERLAAIHKRAWMLGNSSQVGHVKERIAREQRRLATLQADQSRYRALLERGSDGEETKETPGMIEQYIAIVSEEENPAPSVNELAKKTTWSASKWSRWLRDPYSLAELKKVTVRKRGYAKSKRSKALWVDAVLRVEDLGSQAAQRRDRSAARRHGQEKRSAERSRDFRNEGLPESLEEEEIPIKRATQSR